MNHAKYVAISEHINWIFCLYSVDECCLFHLLTVWGCSYHTCGYFLATCSMDKTAKLWDLNRSVKSVQTNADSQTVVTVGEWVSDVFDAAVCQDYS